MKIKNILSKISSKHLQRHLSLKTIFKRYVCLSEKYRFQFEVVDFRSMIRNGNSLKWTDDQHSNSIVYPAYYMQHFLNLMTIASFAPVSQFQQRCQVYIISIPTHTVWAIRLVSWWNFHLYYQFKLTSTDEIHFQRLKFIKFTKLRVCKISCEIRRNAYFNLCKHAPYPKLRIERHCLHFILMHYLCIAYIEKTMNHSLW